MSDNIEARIKYVTHLGDNNLILGHRLSEWCGHGPILEQDIALSNIALDLIGQARLYYQYAAELIGGDTTEDRVAYMRTEREYYNIQLVERPNGHFGDTMARQFIYDIFHFQFLQELKKSADKRLAEIAEKSIKEVAYHRKFSSEWVIRLGDGTAESHERMQSAVNDLWRYGAEAHMMEPYEISLLDAGIAPDVRLLQEPVNQEKLNVLTEATLTAPEVTYPPMGGKQGLHSEFLGHLLAELQYLQRAYPGLEW